MGTSDPVPFGITVSADNLEVAREFYTDIYPNYISITEGVFGTIKYFSLIGQDGEVLVNVLQKQADNPIHGAIPMLKVDSVAQWIAKVEATGGTVVIPQWSALALILTLP
jgi:predicted enzyme related to lactoylglutathione lyase